MEKIIFITLVLLGLPTYANVSEQFSMIPLRYESNIEIGETKEIFIRIRNDMKNKKMENYTLTLQEFILNEEGRLDPTPKTSNNRSLVKFSRVSLDYLNLDPGKEQIIKIIVSVPKDYKYGSGYLAYKLSKSINKKSKGASFGFMKNIIGFIALNIESKKEQNIKIHEAKISQNKLSVVLENLGESYLKTSCKIVLMNDDKKIGVFDLVDDKNREEFLNLPSFKRTVFTILPEKMTKGLKKIKINIIVSDITSDYIKSEILDIDLINKKVFKKK